MKRLLLAMVLAFLTGCVSVGTKVQTTSLDNLVKGEITYQQVINQFGPPQSKGINDKGMRIITYVFSKASPNAASFIPFVGLFAGKTDAESTIVTFIFDKDNKLESYTHAESSIEVSLGGVRNK
jgi:outer membrane protein assembly factor BamE (lipoprotein component of BamABCDE complex)